MQEKLRRLQNAGGAVQQLFFLAQALNFFLQMEEGSLVHLIGAPDHLPPAGEALQRLASRLIQILFQVLWHQKGGFIRQKGIPIQLLADHGGGCRAHTPSEAAAGGEKQVPETAAACQDAHPLPGLEPQQLLHGG